ncbi:MAG TPA: signal peptidase I [Clostridiaceae bacterium]|nr:signal peptidase I [Clostridiaceae bacterium]
MSSEKKTSLYKEILHWLEAILLAFLIALLLRGFVLDKVYVDGSSMERTLSSGDRLIVYKLGYYFDKPKRGDIIVLQANEDSESVNPVFRKLPFLKKFLYGFEETDYIKRVIGLPGEELDIRDGYVYINGVRLDEPYVTPGITENGRISTPIVIEENKYFVLGDNRQNSRDSREIGLIDFDKIRGKAVFRVWPLEKLGKID